MRHVKSERLKKLETELIDLEQWLKLGLVPKSDIEKHKEEIIAVRNKIEEEKERLQFLRESGDVEDVATPKRQTTRAGYTEMPTIPEMETGTSTHSGDSAFDLESESTETETSATQTETREGTEEEAATEDEDMRDEESWYSEKNRWRRGGIADPDADEW